MQHELGQMLEIERATLSGIVTTLVRKGLVEQTPDPADQRQRMLQISASGLKLWDELPDLALIEAVAFDGADAESQSSRRSSKCSKRRRNASTTTWQRNALWRGWTAPHLNPDARRSRLAVPHARYDRHQRAPLCARRDDVGGALGNPDHDDSIRIIHTVLDAGVNFIDTVDAYGDSEVVVMNTTFIAGPSLVAVLRSTLTGFKEIIEGTMPALPRQRFGVVDVRDVADAQIAAMATTTAAGKRYLLLADGPTITWLGLAHILRNHLGPAGEHVTTNEAPGEDSPPLMIHNNRAMHELGWQPRPAETTIVETSDSLRDLGLLEEH